ncbi:hypothetical protein IF1G_03689 [Cordyceps javanica]|uniref:Uncharacterized protein n=1 Tax=Cordyceps javanica TaxID=43265 RepID=A0A545V898_9HYPO|nr:hypothetical protein IF1G_03689 [Cordyceps javanica]TQW08873.1 hypothetical protein IF2G_03304 [Cordyceps javanica]
MCILLGPRIYRFTVRSRAARSFNLSRALHTAKGDFITLNSKGSLTSKQIDIFIGDPREAYIMFNKDVGFAMKASITQQAGMSLSSDPETVPLTFFHDSRCFILYHIHVSL